MATRLRPGPTGWEVSRDEVGHRTYKVRYVVEGLATDGPAAVLQTPGLPVPGDHWAIGDDVDLWAFCRWEATVKPRIEREPNPLWDVELTFSSKPPDLKACRDQEIGDPLLEPMKVSGSFVRYQEEAYFDRFGSAVVNSAFEQIRGPQVEFDANRPQVRVEQNVADLQLSFIADLVDKVNAFALWGLPPRTIKLSNVTWERKFYGQCSVYYTRVLEFDIRADGGFDRDILDEGTKVLHGHWEELTGIYLLDAIGGFTPDENNPAHFDRFKDRAGENSRVILNGHGRPAGVLIGSTDRYISLADDNLGNALDNEDWWILVYGPTENIAEWVSGFEYIKGNLVTWKDVLHEDGVLYVALQDPPELIPPDDPLVANIWFPLIYPGEPNDRGDYDAGITYGIADLVRDVSAGKTTSGSIHLEKYDEADFLLLGIPASF
jgi:hypothetical protein